MEKGKELVDSSDEGGTCSEDELVLLQAASNILTRSLKRKRERSKFDACKKKQIIRDRRQGRPVVDKDVSVSKSRYNLNYLITIIKDFNEKQRQIVREAGFGAVLELDGGAVPWSFVKWLADHVGPKDEAMFFEEKTIPVCSDSFGHVLGIRTSGIPVPAETKTSTAEFFNLFDLSDMPSIKFFGEKIMKKKQKEDEFLVCFMVVAFSCFYCPTSNTRPSTAYLAGFLQTDKIKSYNWGKFVQEWNMYYIKKYQRSSSTLAVCNYYFAVRYLDFVYFGSFQIEKALPRISVWKGDMIKEHIKLVMDEDHFYGKLPVKHISETCYPFVCTTPPASHTMSVQQLKRSIQAFESTKFSEQVTSNICSLFEQCTVNESEFTCTKVQELVIKVVECLIENKCIASVSQSTEKLKRSQGDENTSSGSTVKLQSSENSSGVNEKHGKANFRTDVRDSQHSTCSGATHQEKVVQEDTTVSVTDQIKDLFVGPKTKPMHTIDDKIVHERVMHVNTSLCKLQIKENMEFTKSDHRNTESENQQNREDIQIQSFSNNSASFEHMLNNEAENRATRSGLEEGTSNYTTANPEQNKIDIDPKTPTTTLDMFKVIGSTGKGKSESVIYINSSSIQCAQKVDDSDKQIVKYVPPSAYYNQELSSETRNQSQSTEEQVAKLDDMNFDDFGFGDDQPSIPIEVAWLNAPRNQQIRNYRMRQMQEQQKKLQDEVKAKTGNGNYVDLKRPTSPREPVNSPQDHKHNGCAEEENHWNSPASPQIVKDRNTIIISSQDSPEVKCLGQRQASTSSIPEDIYEEVYIGQHRLSPIRKNKSEVIDQMYNQRAASTQFPLDSSTSMSSYKTPLQPRRMVLASKYVVSPYDVNVCSNEPSDQENQYYQSIIRLASMEKYKNHKAILVDNCKITMETFGNSMKARGVVEAWVINVFSRILFREKHPKESNRHTFFHMSSEYFLEKWENEGRRIYLRDQAIRAFEGAGKAKKLHLTELLHFPSLQNEHWFLFTVDIRDEKFFFMDSYYNKYSKLHKENDEKMIKNFEEIWNVCREKQIDFSNFDRVYPKVPQQNNNKDCGIFVMKNIQLFSPRNNLMGVYSFKDIPKIRVQLTNHMMFNKFNEMEGMKQAVAEFDPRVHGTFARQS